MAHLYESLFILRPLLADEEVQKLLEKVKGLLEKAGGTIERLESWGKRKLAYEVKHEKKGVFVQLIYRGDGAVVTELERFFRLDDGLLKFMTIRLKDERLSTPPGAPAAEPEHGRF